MTMTRQQAGTPTQFVKVTHPVRINDPVSEIIEQSIIPDANASEISESSGIETINPSISILSIINESKTANVSAVDNFSLSVSPYSRTVLLGGYVLYSVSIIKSGNFSGRAILTTDELPDGVSAKFYPLEITESDSSTLKLTVDLHANVTTLSLTVRATSVESPVMTDNAVITLAISSFDLSVEKSSRSKDVLNINVNAVNGFTGSVLLGLAELSSSITGTFSNNSINTSGSATLTLKLRTKGTKRSTSSVISVTGRCGSLIKTVQLQLQ